MVSCPVAPAVPGPPYAAEVIRFRRKVAARNSLNPMGGRV